MAAEEPQTPGLVDWNEVERLDSRPEEERKKEYEDHQAAFITQLDRINQELDDSELHTDREKAPETRSPPNGTKRKQSQTPEQENKRARTSPGPEDAPPQAEGDAPGQDRTGSHDVALPSPARKESVLQHSSTPFDLPKRVRKTVDPNERNKRLFGAAFGTIAGKSTDRQSKRRQELEARKKEEREKREAQEAEDRVQNYEKLKIHRRKEQIIVDEEVMKTRHCSMLHGANFLWTEAEPKLSYRPYELSPEQEEKIAQQIEEAQREIDKEVVEFESKKLDALAALDGETSGVEKPAMENGDARVSGGEHSAGDGGGAPAATGQDQSGDAPSNGIVHMAEQDSGAHLEATSKPAMPLNGPTQNVVAGDSGDTAVCKDDGNRAVSGQGENAKQDDNHAEENAEHVYEGDEDTLIY
ncbi:hypothetical protein MBLNU230_g8046t1 [Neophaeotheca triangularis]